MTPVLEFRDDAALITLNRPDAMNALSFAILGHLDELLGEVAGSKARVLLITGAGSQAFCAGADIKELRDRTQVQQYDGARLGQRVFERIDQLPIPSIALINGFAFGGGLEMALACSFRLAVPEAKMGLPEIRLGLVPGYGGTQRLPRLIGESRALDMILTGRTVAADEALQCGLINQIVDADLIAAGLAYAATFTRYSLPVMAMSRSAVSRALDNPIAEGLKIEADLSTRAYQTHDAAEGMAAFEEKRKPRFRDE